MSAEYNYYDYDYHIKAMLFVNKLNLETSVKYISDFKNAKIIQMTYSGGTVK